MSDGPGGWISWGHSHGQESTGDSQLSSLHSAQREELAVEGSHFSPPALNLGPCFEGKVAKPAKSQCTPRLVPTPSGNLLGPAPKPVCPSSSSLMPLPRPFTREFSHLLRVSKDRAAMPSSKLCTQYSLSLEHFPLSPTALWSTWKSFVSLLKFPG